jgi:Diguanylate cyclase, GGDEF domain
MILRASSIYSSTNRSAPGPVSMIRSGRDLRLSIKTVNVRFGHAAGDAVLTQLAQRIVALLRVGDTAARLGGDEFAVLCDAPNHATPRPSRSGCGRRPPNPS